MAVAGLALGACAGTGPSSTTQAAPAAASVPAATTGTLSSPAGGIPTAPALTTQTPSAPVAPSSPPAAPASAPPPAPARPAAVSGIPAVWTACTTSLAGQQVAIGAGEHTRTVVDQSDRTHAVVSFFVRSPDAPCSFQLGYQDASARIGSRGTKPAAARRGGDDTTPLGTFTMSEAFGFAPSYPTALPYRALGPASYFVWDMRSAYFNGFRELSQGGFRPAKSEHVLDYSYYRLGVLIDFNRPPDSVVRARGSGIRFHVKNSLPTNGCVAIEEEGMRYVLTVMHPGDKITIVA